jgi:VIT1/CCC1 family predicted Fe2+/Mn2+ transporter
MSLLSLLLTLAVLGVVLWLLTAVIPMDATIRKIIVAVVAVLAVCYVLQAFGVLGPLPVRLR